MLKEEAIWLGQVLSKIPDSELFPVLNLGSSSGEFRATRQPWIDEHIFQPLLARGGRIIHTDLQNTDGVDIPGDLMDPEFRAQLRTLEPRSFICCNLLEHLSEPEPFSHAIADLADPGSYILASCPSSYPYHPNPIDTLYRPNVEELAAMFPHTALVASHEVSSHSFGHELVRNPQKLLRVLLPFYKPKSWLGVVHRFGWLFRPYKVSCALLKKER